MDEMWAIYKFVYVLLMIVGFAVVFYMLKENKRD
jgi:hypothetical protein